MRASRSADGCCGRLRPWKRRSDRRVCQPGDLLILTICCGAFGAVGDAGVPPGGMVNYLVLPVWLIVAVFIIARSQKRAAEPTPRAQTVCQPVTSRHVTEG